VTSRVGAVLALALALAGCRRDEASAPAASPSSPSSPSAVVAPPAAPPAVTKRAPPPPARLARVTIKALGMYCEESCPLKVRSALAGVASVYELGFDLSTESIFVSYDASLGPAKQVTRPMIAAIKGAGFDPWLARETWPEGVNAQVIAR
jgi:hypothetical protein